MPLETTDCTDGAFLLMASFGVLTLDEKMDPYYQQQKCRPIILVSGNIRFMRIFAWFLGKGHQTTVGLLFQ